MCWGSAWGILTNPAGLPALVCRVPGPGHPAGDLDHMTAASTFACDVDVDGDPFEVPWRFTLRRPGRAPYTARCRVRLGETASGEPWLKVEWLGTIRPEVRGSLELAMQARLLDVLPAGHDLVKLNGPLGTTRKTSPRSN